MKVKYKTDYKLIKGKEIVAYKIYVGFYVFFVSPKLYKQAIKEGLIEEQDQLSIKDRTWFSMTSSRGKVTEYRIKKALKLSNLEYLKESLERVNKELGLYEIIYYTKEDLCWKLIINTSTFTVEKFKKTEIGERWQWVREKLTYIFILDVLCNHLDRGYMNSRHLIDKLKEVSGFEGTFGPYDSQNRIEIKELS